MKQIVKRHLSFLTGVNDFRNYWNFKGLKSVVDYLREEMESYGLSVTLQEWTARGNQYQNIIAQFRPESTKRLVVGAHYDVFSNQPGADDNASGVTGLLVLARHIAQSQPKLPYGIDFVAYCLEEPPFFGTQYMGSYQHANLLHKNSIPVIGMIALDMIGYFSDEENSQRYPTKSLAQHFPSIGNFITVIGLKQHKDFNYFIKEHLPSTPALPIYHFNFNSNKGLAGLSDHRNYWHFGYPAIMINDTASYRNPHYHKKTDTIDTLNLEKMVSVIEALTVLLETPFQIDPVIGKTPALNPLKKKPSFLERIRKWFARFKS